MVTLTTERLVLRPWRDDDADFLFDLYSRWEVARYLGAEPAVMRTRDEAVASIERRRALDHPLYGVWAVATADDQLVGTVLLKPIPLSDGESPHQEGADDVEVGWHLHPDAWGNGYATEAAAAVLDHAFDQGLSRVVAVTYPQNLASQAVCRRLGMTHLGLSRRYYGVEAELFEKLAG